MAELDAGDRWAMGLMIMADGTIGSVTHLDTLRRCHDGWRISHRIIRPQRTPMSGAFPAAPAGGQS
jgi:hypothetical protein